jgi:hypothetical protein
VSGLYGVGFSKVAISGIPKSVRECQVRDQIRETPIERTRKRRRDNEQKTTAEGPVKLQERPEPGGNGELPPAGRRGAAAALPRLEHQEEESHRRLQAALARGDSSRIQQVQELVKMF